MAVENREKPTSAKGGVQSVEIGMRLLKALAAIGGRATLNELSEAVEMHPAKTHRYLVSLVETGFVEKSAHGRYDLGPYVLEFATAYLSRLEPTTVANPIVDQLWSETQEGIILCVWGGSGTTVIRWLQSRQPISVGIRPGTVFSTSMSASGRIFLAYLPRALTQPIVDAELKQFAQERTPLAPQSAQELEAIIEETREHGMARVTGHSIEYVSALAAPVFDYRGELVLSLALFGFKSNFDVSWDGENARLLRDTADKLSARLGYVKEPSVNS
ncbi:MAG: IclR family transcriptional regulator [Chromatiales bacterium]|nr:IclR family transcriptional regulator [Chromatiales bacterium]